MFFLVDFALVDVASGVRIFDSLLFVHLSSIHLTIMQFLRHDKGDLLYFGRIGWSGTCALREKFIRF